MDFIETTALRQRRNGGREVTVTSRLHRQKDKERQRKTAEKGDRRPAVAAGAGVRWRGSSTGAPGAGLRITVAKDLRDQGSRLSTGQAEGGKVFLTEIVESMLTSLSHQLSSLSNFARRREQESKASSRPR